MSKTKTIAKKETDAHVKALYADKCVQEIKALLAGLTVEDATDIIGRVCVGDHILVPVYVLAITLQEVNGTKLVLTNEGSKIKMELLGTDDKPLDL